MLSIQPTSKPPPKCTPNLLPARISHAGPINNTEQYWKPVTDDKGTQHVYFRGRHLHGTKLPLPANYTGTVLSVTEKDLPASKAPNDGVENEDEEGDDEAVEVKIAERVGEFEEVVIWGHGDPVDANEDVYIKGVNEWIGFAEAMHCEEQEDDGNNGEKASKGS